MMAIEARLDELERENRSLRADLRRCVRHARLASVLVVVLLSAGAASFASRKNMDVDILSARQIRVVDEDGKAKVMIAGNKQSNPQIVQGYVAVLDDKQNASAILGHWGNADLLWFANGDSNGNNLVLGAMKDEVVIHSAHKGKYNYRIFADATTSGIRFSDRTTPATAESTLKDTVKSDLATKGEP